MGVIFKFLIYFLMFITLITAFAFVIGVLRFNDVYKQIHISSILDMLGVPIYLFTISLLFLKKGNFFVFGKMIILIITWYILSPIMNYCVIKIVHFYNKKEKSN